MLNEPPCFPFAPVSRTTPPMHIERFAPSPTGPLHLGHAYSAWCGWSRARAAGGRFLLRLEDLDTARVRPEWSALILEDLRWLGLDWDGPVLAQSARTDAYASALDTLLDRGLLYACTCTRRDIRDAISAPQEGHTPALGPDGPIYPGTCRNAGHALTADAALRLDIAKAIDALEEDPNLDFHELGEGPAGESGEIAVNASSLQATTGDVVLRRRDGAPAYHLAVVIDDAHQSVTHVTRGIDLFSSVPIQRLLQRLLGLPTPLYCHHGLVRDAEGKRLAKRDDARAIATYRADGLTPADVRALAGIPDF